MTIGTERGRFTALETGNTAIGAFLSPGATSSVDRYDLTRMLPAPPGSREGVSCGKKALSKSG